MQRAQQIIADLRRMTMLLAPWPWAWLALSQLLMLLLPGTAMGACTNNCDPGWGKCPVAPNSTPGTPGYPGGIPCGCAPAYKTTATHLRLMSMIDDRAQTTRASQVEWVNLPLVLDMRYPTDPHSSNAVHTGEMITAAQVAAGMAGMVMFDGHVLPSGLQPLVFDRTTHGLTPGWENITDNFAKALTPYMANNSIQAVQIGDEIVCSGTPFALFDTVVTRLRQKLDAVTALLGPTFNTLLFYTNECGDVFAGWPYIPLSLDYVSIDMYTDPSNTPESTWCTTVNTSSASLYPVPKRVCRSSEVAVVKSTLRHEVYPKLRVTNRTWSAPSVAGPPQYRHQGVVLVPGVSSSCAGDDTACAIAEDVIVKKLDEYWQWAREDWLVGGFMP